MHHEMREKILVGIDASPSLVAARYRCTKSYVALTSLQRHAFGSRLNHAMDVPKKGLAALMIYVKG
jgi:hypothetical protein